MAPSSRSVPEFEKEEKVLCYHGPIMYDAKVVDVRQLDPKDKKSDWEYYVHYQGWKKT